MLQKKSKNSAGKSLLCLIIWEPTRDQQSYLIYIQYERKKIKIHVNISTQVQSLAQMDPQFTAHTNKLQLELSTQRSDKAAHLRDR